MGPEKYGRDERDERAWKNSPIVGPEIFCDSKTGCRWKMSIAFELETEQVRVWEWIRTASRGISKPAYCNVTMCVCLLKYKKWISLKCQFIFHMRYCKLKLGMQNAAPENYFTSFITAVSTFQMMNGQRWFQVSWRKKDGKKVSMNS